jgi:hypothetical protein
VSRGGFWLGLGDGEERLFSTVLAILLMPYKPPPVMMAVLMIPIVDESFGDVLIERCLKTEIYGRLIEDESA